MDIMSRECVCVCVTVCVCVCVYCITDGVNNVAHLHIYAMAFMGLVFVISPGDAELASLAGRVVGGKNLIFADSALGRSTAAASITTAGLTHLSEVTAYDDLFEKKNTCH